MFQTSQRGNGLLLDQEGGLYYSNDKHGDKVQWKCRQYRKTKCLARALTKGSFVIKWSGAHNHPLG